MTVAKRALLAVAIACVAPGARAIGLGSLELHSALNQPLHATVTLRDVNMDALDEVSARIAPADRYAATDLVRDDYLRNLRLVVERIDGRPVVTVRGASALREPVIDLLIEVQQGRQSVQRAYTLLVDPPRTAGDPEPVESAGRVVDPAEGMPADAAPAAATAGTDAGSGADAGAASPAPTASSTSGASADAGSADASAPDTTTTEAATPALAAAEPTA
ncbi:type IV pilus assembly protein FimV, partial [Algiphilus sp.]|uniref:type IV pilus assembly protein FimV n=1 Tax=Algiphilus sp. TaxID=1872431 RepID=UPI003C689D5B